MSEKRHPLQTGPCLRRHPSRHLRGSVNVMAPPLGVQAGRAPRVHPAKAPKRPLATNSGHKFHVHLMTKMHRPTRESRTQGRKLLGFGSDGKSLNAIAASRAFRLPTHVKCGAQQGTRQRSLLVEPSRVHLALQQSHAANSCDSTPEPTTAVAPHTARGLYYTIIYHNILSHTQEFHRSAHAGPHAQDMILRTMRRLPGAYREFTREGSAPTLRG